LLEDPRRDKIYLSAEQKSGTNERGRLFTPAGKQKIRSIKETRLGIDLPAGKSGKGSSIRGERFHSKNLKTLQMAVHCRKKEKERSGWKGTEREVQHLQSFTSGIDPG